jgi:DNA (cytosine-5)-methyltransferase 1
VAQRRRRVFVVGYLGDWRPAAAVLFERHSLRRDLAPSAPQGKKPSAYFESSLAQYREGDIGGTLKASGGVLGGGSETFITYPVDVPDVMSTLLSSTAGISRPGNAVTEHITYIPMSNKKVRRLTPKECERLQGFPDGFTDIPWRKKDTSPDGLRYKALGNSMAVPCMQWIGDGIDLVDKL